ncbi:MAG: signal peptidase I [Chloroflexi bacterium]|nr:signal peptidase I [Chloroflexota bacterium]MBV9597799.1 signal peptidase I [Chloroflexota bacterium]
MFDLIMMQASSGLTNTAGLLAGLAFNLFMALVVYVVYVIGAWKVFTKADRPGWWSIIPIWNAAVLLQISGRSGWWVLGYVVPLLNLFVQIRWGVEMANSYGRGVGFAIGLILLEPLFLVILGFGGARYLGPAARAPQSAPAAAI